MSVYYIYIFSIEEGMRRGVSNLNHNRLQPYGIDSHLMQTSPPPLNSSLYKSKTSRSLHNKNKHTEQHISIHEKVMNVFLTLIKKKLANLEGIEC
jgi:hypothetical protein